MGIKQSHQGRPILCTLRAVPSTTRTGGLCIYIWTRFERRNRSHNNRAVALYTINVTRTLIFLFQHLHGSECPKEWKVVGPDPDHSSFDKVPHPHQGMPVMLALLLHLCLISKDPIQLHELLRAYSFIRRGPTLIPSLPKPVSTSHFLHSGFFLLLAGAGVSL